MTGEEGRDEKVIFLLSKPDRLLGRVLLLLVPKDTG